MDHRDLQVSNFMRNKGLNIENLYKMECEIEKIMRDLVKLIFCLLDSTLLVHILLLMSFYENL